MRPLGFLFCLGKALVRHLSKLAGAVWPAEIAIQVSQEIWKEWQGDEDKDQRQSELAAIVDMAAQDFERRVDDVVRKVAGELDAKMQKRLAQAMKKITDLLRQSFQSSGESSLEDSSDLADLLMGQKESSSARVTLIQTGGALQGRKFVFDGRFSSILGRGKGCQPSFPQDKDHSVISRHHCLLDVNPPDVLVRDLGSRTGTYVNGQLIGMRPKEMGSTEGKRLRLEECILKDGDELKLTVKGHAVFQVKIEVPAQCAGCGSPWPKLVQPGTEAGLRCASCQARPTSATRDLKRTCVQCMRDVTDEPGADRQGDYVCSKCRQKKARSNADAPTIPGYTVLKLLGRGGMGAVWLGRKDSNGELAALKVMLPQVAADRRAVKRFLREIESTRALTHPNLVRLIGSGYSHGTFFLALDYCDGGSVADLMKQRGGTLPIDEAAEIILQALEGLNFAHNLLGPGKGLVHRDLKPANLFLTGTGSARVAKVGDYGLAKAFDDAGLSGATRTGEAAGTPYFMPRQQIKHFKYATADVDVWAMAASLYNMLTGRFVRRFPTGLDRWIAVLETDAVPIREYKPELPRKLAEVIDAALVEEPSIGFATAAAFKKALERAL